MRSFPLVRCLLEFKNAVLYITLNTVFAVIYNFVCFVGVSVPYRHHLPNLQPFSFELPHAVASEGVFVGREWLFSETLEVLNDPSTKGVVITFVLFNLSTVFENELNV